MGRLQGLTERRGFLLNQFFQTPHYGYERQLQRVRDLTCANGRAHDGAHEDVDADVSVGQVTVGSKLALELGGARSVLGVSCAALWRKPSLNQGIRKLSRKLGRATNAFELFAYAKRRQFKDTSDGCSRFI
jgi:hypothetical protein